jgi:hypothetical protein
MVSNFTTKLICIALVFNMMVFAGCIEEKREFTINPDGSGKVVYDVIFTLVNINLDGEESDTQEDIKLAVNGILQDSKGVDTWKDISYEMTDNGEIHFTGTALFPDIELLDISAGGFSDDEKIHFFKNELGQIVIEIRQDSDPEEEDTSSEEEQEAEELSEAELAQKIKEAKFEYNKTKPMILSMLGTLRKEAIFHLPGTITEISNFEKIDGTTVQFTFEGNRIIEAMEKMMADDDLLREQILAGKNLMQDGPGDELLANEMVYGQRAPVRVVFDSTGKSLFDYDVEVAATKENYKKMLEESGLPGETGPTIRIASEKLAKPGSTTVVGVRLVKYTDTDRGIRPFNYDKGYTLSLVSELPGPAIEASKGYVEEAVTDTGQSLLPTKEWDRKIHWPKLTDDKKAIVFDVKLLVPDKDVSKLEEVSGEVGYLTAGSVKELDLGLMDFKEGAKSGVEGFSVNSIEIEEWDKEHTVMELKVNLSEGSLKSTRFYDENGKKFEVTRSGSSSSNDRLLEVGFRTKGKFPPRGRIVMEVHEELTEHRVPFKLTNISLTGHYLD